MISLKNKLKLRYYRRKLVSRSFFVVGSLILMFMLFSSVKDTKAQPQMPLRENPVKVVESVVATAYNSLENQTDSTPWITASGYKCKEGVIACNFLPFGTKVWIKGHGSKPYIVRDRMNRRYTKRVDIWMRSYKDAIKFGKRDIIIAYFVKPNQVEL